MSSTPVAHRALIARSKLRYGTVTYIRPDGSSAGAYPLTKTKFSIGRSEERDIRVRSKEASGEHCILTVDEDTQPFSCFITDLSANGTNLNGRWLENGVQVALNDGDLIGIGIARFRFNSLSQIEQTEMNGFLNVINQAGVAASVRSMRGELKNLLEETRAIESPPKKEYELLSVPTSEPSQISAKAVVMKYDTGRNTDLSCAEISTEPILGLKLFESQPSNVDQETQNHTSSNVLESIPVLPLDKRDDFQDNPSPPQLRCWDISITNDERTETSEHTDGVEEMVTGAIMEKAFAKVERPVKESHVSANLISAGATDNTHTDSSHADTAPTSLSGAPCAPTLQFENEQVQESIKSPKKRAMGSVAEPIDEITDYEDQPKDCGSPSKRTKLSLLDRELTVQPEINDVREDTHRDSTLLPSDSESPDEIVADTMVQSATFRNGGNALEFSTTHLDLPNSPELSAIQFSGSNGSPVKSVYGPDQLKDDKCSESAELGAISVASNTTHTQMSLSFTDPLDAPRRVSFGPPLSPEIFDRELPPDTPVKRGQRVSSHPTPIGDNVKVPASPLAHLSTSRKQFVLKSALKCRDRSIPPLTFTTDQVNPFVIRQAKQSNEVATSSSSSSEITSPVQPERRQSKSRSIPFKYGVPTVIERARTPTVARSNPRNQPILRKSLRLIATEPRKLPSSVGRVQTTGDFNKRYLKELEDQTDGIIKDFALKLKRSKSDQDTQSSSLADANLQKGTQITAKKFDISQFRFQKSTAIDSWQKMEQPSISEPVNSSSSDHPPTPSEQDASHDDCSVGSDGGICGILEESNQQSLGCPREVLDLDMESRYVQYPEEESDAVVDAILNQELVVAEGSTIENESSCPAADSVSTNDAGLRDERKTLALGPISISMAEETVELDTSEEAQASLSFGGLVCIDASLNEESAAGAATTDHGNVIAIVITNHEAEASAINVDNVDRVDGPEPSSNEEIAQNNSDTIDAENCVMVKEKADIRNSTISGEMDNSLELLGLNQSANDLQSLENVGELVDVASVEDVSIPRDIYEEPTDVDSATVGDETNGIPCDSLEEDRDKDDEMHIRSDDEESHLSETSSGVDDDREPDEVQTGIVSVDHLETEFLFAEDSMIRTMNISRDSDDSDLESSHRPLHEAAASNDVINDLQATDEGNRDCVMEQERAEEQQLDKPNGNDNQDTSSDVQFEVSIECIEDLEKAVSFLLEGGDTDDDGRKDNEKGHHSEQVVEAIVKNFPAAVYNEHQMPSSSTDESENNSIGSTIVPAAFTFDNDTQPVGRTDPVIEKIEQVAENEENAPTKRKRGRPRKAIQLYSHQRVEQKFNEQQSAQTATKRGTRRALDEGEGQTNIDENEGIEARKIKRSRSKVKHDERDEKETNPIEPSKALNARAGKRGRAKAKDDVVEHDENIELSDGPLKAPNTRGGKRMRTKEKEEDVEQDENLAPTITANSDEPPKKASKSRGGKPLRKKEKDDEVEPDENVEPANTGISGELPKTSNPRGDIRTRTKEMDDFEQEENVERLTVGKKPASKVAKSGVRRTTTVTMDGETSPFRTYNFRKRK
ncbi:hypothetical protein BJ742DRAFT_773277 [Cladochytrium replicatum]|nr:hypothetical protein BJ742DRAFT_773277 [Cladochytrium replicatum]